MPDTAQQFHDVRPRKVCRSTEARDTAILTLALWSLLAVKADKDASWPCRIHPLSQFEQHDQPD